ncbi:MAG: radical SAM protein [Bacteroidetes bacterium]|nr:MAG: radical SAM protein [Bacteroidota bacterium]
MKIIRVFPRRTNLSPNDYNVRFGPPLLLDRADEVHISVTFSYDLKQAEWLALQWKEIAPVIIGGPATGQAGGNFIPGMYLKYGAVITSRGCNNRCWFCSVPVREGMVRELPIQEGWIVLDDNLLSCSPAHIDKVFEMLRRQKRKPEFTGGLEAKLLTKELAKQLKELNPESLFFAYDTKDDLDPLINAGELLREAGYSKNNHRLRCYVLVGYPADRLDKAEKRLLQAYDAGFLPMSMLYRDKSGSRDPFWIKFNNEWANPVKTSCNCLNRTSRTKQKFILPNI